ncbi:uncharacterized protein CG4449 [Drosophila hydei]|uniref:Uncharacterized protein CG4449 n=1 Tax=Drosophila hydei TaxID=7224 RepID=A0A6J1LQN5_DROHY|nr:uncharacterized protein CG4449 [Drosophila hydei]
MSDDDCDIFNMPVKRLNVVPQKHCTEDLDSKQIDYDFIKKPTTKSIKQTAQIKPKSKAKSGNRKKQEKDEEKLINNNTQEVTSPTLGEAQAPISRADLSPVSQLIYEMEQKQERIKTKEMEALPVARRTRSSIGKRQPTPEKINELEVPAPAVIAVVPARANKRSGRGRKATAQTAETSSSTAPRNMVEPTKRNRRQAAEIAAYSRVVDSIDLVSAVAPRVEGFINLDSDEENETSPAEPEKATLSYDDDNPIIEINLNWLGEMQVYKLRQHQKFSHMFKEVSKRNGVPVDDVVINMDDLFLNAVDSPQSVGLKGFHILSGRALKSHKNQHKEDVNLMAKPRKFQLKIQNDKWKQPLIIPMKKTETFKMLYIKCAEEMECDVKDFKLFFDGDLLEPDDTPKNQDMEGNEIIDYRSK